MTWITSFVVSAMCVIGALLASCSKAGRIWEEILLAPRDSYQFIESFMYKMNVHDRFVTVFLFGSG